MGERRDLLVIIICLEIDTGFAWACTKIVRIIVWACTKIVVIILN